MRQFLEGIFLLLSQKQSRALFFVSIIALLLGSFGIENGSETLSIFRFETLTLTKQYALALSTFFNVSNTFTGPEVFLLSLGILLSSLNISLAYTYLTLRGKILVRSGLYSGFGLVLALFGVGCAACGTALLSITASALGFSSLLGTLPLHGLEVGYTGIIILLLATYTLGKKVATPLVC